MNGAPSPRWCRSARVERVDGRRRWRGILVRSTQRPGGRTREHGVSLAPTHLIPLSSQRHTKARELRGTPGLPQVCSASGLSGFGRAGLARSGVRASASTCHVLRSGTSGRLLARRATSDDASGGRGPLFVGLRSSVSAAVAWLVPCRRGVRRRAVVEARRWSARPRRAGNAALRRSAPCGMLGSKAGGSDGTPSGTPRPCSAGSA